MASWLKQEENIINHSVAYVDVKAAFDSVDRSVLWELMRVLELLPKILSIIEALYCTTGNSVRVDVNTSDCFLIKSGVRQAPDCFDIAMD